MGYTGSCRRSKRSMDRSPARSLLPAPGRSLALSAFVPDRHATASGPASPPATRFSTSSLRASWPSPAARTGGRTAVNVAYQIQQVRHRESAPGAAQTHIAPWSRGGCCTSRKRSRSKSRGAALFARIDNPPARSSAIRCARWRASLWLPNLSPAYCGTARCYQTHRMVVNQPIHQPIPAKSLHHHSQLATSGSMPPEPAPVIRQTLLVLHPFFVIDHRQHPIDECRSIAA